MVRFVLAMTVQVKREEIKHEDVEMPDAAPGADDQDEPRYPTGPQGRLETIAQKEAREAHNMYVKFSRTFNSILANLAGQVHGHGSCMYPLIEAPHAHQRSWMHPKIASTAPQVALDCSHVLHASCKLS